MLSMTVTEFQMITSNSFKEYIVYDYCNMVSSKLTFFFVKHEEIVVVPF